MLMSVAAASRPTVSLLLAASARIEGAGSFSVLLMPSTVIDGCVECQDGNVEKLRECVTNPYTGVITSALAWGTLQYVSKTQNQDSEIERHFMRALTVALADKGMNLTQAEQKAELSPGTLSLWTRGKRMPSAIRFAEVVASMGLNPGDVLNDGMRRAREAGLLDGAKLREDD